MKRFAPIFFCSLISIILTGVGCRTCDTCYPLGGLLGKKNQECTCGDCPVTPRVGSIVDAPQEVIDPAGISDPSTLATEGAASSSPSPAGP
jgi:hypothetical protein